MIVMCPRTTSSVFFGLAYFCFLFVQISARLTGAQRCAEGPTVEGGLYVCVCVYEDYSCTEKREEPDNEKQESKNTLILCV